MATRNRDGRLEDALATLINSQATLLGQLASLAARSDERFARIENELKALGEIKMILVRHEQMLQALPEAVREKIGFKNR
jgi:hypothetical protein